MYRSLKVFARQWDKWKKGSLFNRIKAFFFAAKFGRQLFTYTHIQAYKYFALSDSDVIAFFLGRFVGVRVGVAKFFLGQSICIDKTNTFQFTFSIYHQNCRNHSFGRFVGVRVGVALY